MLALMSGVQPHQDSRESGTSRPDARQAADARAPAVVAEAVVIAREAESEAVAESALVIAAAADAAADRVTNAAVRARGARSLAAAEAARVVAADVLRSAAAIQARAELAAVEVAEAAAQAAVIVAASRSGGGRDDSLAAERIAATVSTAARVTAQHVAEAAEAAAGVAAAAASHVAMMVSAVDTEFESEVAAAALRSSRPERGDSAARRGRRPGAGRGCGARSAPCRGRGTPLRPLVQSPDEAFACQLRGPRRTGRGDLRPPGPERGGTSSASPPNFIVTSSHLWVKDRRDRSVDAPDRCTFPDRGRTHDPPGGSSLVADRTRVFKAFGRAGKDTPSARTHLIASSHVCLLKETGVGVTRASAAEDGSDDPTAWPPR